MCPCLFCPFRAMFIRRLSVYKEQWGRNYRRLHHRHDRHNYRDVLCFFLWFSYVLVCSLFTVVKNGLTVLKRWPAVVVQRDLSTQRFVLFWVLFSSTFFSQGGKISVVCSIFSPASCLWNLLGWVTFDFCDIHSFRQRSHVVPGHGVQVRYPLGTNVNTLFFQAYPR